LVASPQANVDRKTFLRDILVYMAVVALIAGIASDGHISIFESIGLLVTYFLYVGLVVVLSRGDERGEGGAAPPGEGYVRANDQDGSNGAAKPTSLNGGDFAGAPAIKSDQSDLNQPLVASVDSVGGDDITDTGSGVDDEDGPEPLAGLTLPSQSGVGDGAMSLQKRAWILLLQSQVVLEGPFTVLRWASTPAIDGYWDGPRWITAVVAPIGFMQALLVDAYGPDAYSAQWYFGPMYASALLLGLLGSGIIFGLTRGSVDPDDPKALPAIYSLLALGAFASSVVWMDLIANEAVALMESLGVILEISTAVLGLTILALGNSVGDLIADLAVARTGQARMAVATCFGSPLLNDILGLGIALTLTCAQDYPHPFRSHVNRSLIIAWFFLGVSLVSSLAVFHNYNYTPPRQYAYFLFSVYIVFVAVSITNEIM